MELVERLRQIEEQTKKAQEGWNKCLPRTINVTLLVYGFKGEACNVLGISAIR